MTERDPLSGLFCNKGQAPSRGTVRRLCANEGHVRALPIGIILSRLLITLHRNLFAYPHEGKHHPF